MLRLCRGCILGVASLLPAVAGAADAPDVAIVGLHQQGLDLDRQEALTLRLIALMSDSGKVRGLSTAQLAGSIQGREGLLLEEGLLGPGRAKLDAAIELYNQAQPDAAISMLGEAVFELERAFPGVTSVDDLWTAHLYLGSAQVQLGESGAEAFEAAVALAPERSPDPAKFPPDVVGAYDAARERLKATPTNVTISVTSVVPVVVDGVSRGPAPARVEGLLPGVHHVVVVGPRGSRGYKRLVVEPPGGAAPGGGEEAPAGVVPELEVSVVLEEPFLGTAGPSRRERADQVASLYQALGRRAPDVEYVLLGGTEEDELHLQLYHAPSDSFSRAIDVPFTEWADDEVVTAFPLLLNLVGKDGSLTATSEEAVPLDIGANSLLASLLLNPPAPEPIEASRGADKKRGGLVWGIVAGAAVVGLAGGGVYLATQGGGGGEPTPTTTPIASSGTVVIDF